MPYGYVSILYKPQTHLELHAFNRSYSMSHIFYLATTAGATNLYTATNAAADNASNAISYAAAGNTTIYVATYVSVSNAATNVQCSSDANAMPSSTFQPSIQTTNAKKFLTFFARETRQRSISLYIYMKVRLRENLFFII